jgi:hypothetical protein
MKIKVQSNTEEVLSLEGGYITDNHSVDIMIGNVLTIIETLGLSEKQEKSAKDLTKQAIRRGLDVHQNCFISSEVYNLICRFNQELHEQLIKNPESNPMENPGDSPRDGSYELTFTSAR